MRRAFRSTDWDRILVSVEAYKKAEALLHGAGGTSPAALAKAKPRLLKLLVRIEKACDGWLKRNDAAGAHHQAEQWPSRMNVSDKERTGGQDDAVGGQVNRLDHVISGATEGYSKPEQGFAKDPEPHGSESGIRQSTRTAAPARSRCRASTNSWAPTSSRGPSSPRFGTITETATGVAGKDMDAAMSDATAGPA